MMMMMIMMMMRVVTVRVNYKVEQMMVGRRRRR